MLSKNELGLIKANLEDANAYDEEQGGPLALMHAVRDIPTLIQEVEKLNSILETIHVGAFGQQYKDQWAASVVRLINKEHRGIKGTTG